MATIKQSETKDGKRFFKIAVSRGYGKAPYTMRWYWPDGWSERYATREAEKVAAEFELKCNAGEVLNREQQKEQAALEAAEAAKIKTLRQYAELVFLPALEVTCSELTRYNFTNTLKTYVFPVLGSMKLPEITSAQITALLLKVQKRGLSHSTCVRVYSILNMLFKRAYLDETIDRNPMDRVQRPKPAKSEGKDQEISAYTGQELKYIMECLENEPLKWRAFIRLLIDTGCRRGEAAGLTWDNIDFQENSILIEKGLYYSPKKGIYTDTPKSGKKRKIFVDPSVMELLKEIRRTQTFSGKDGFVFTQDHSTAPMHPDSPTRYFKRFGQRYDIPDFHPHKLRHSFASVAITNGADVASVSEKLGHADKAITLRMYTHADEESQKRASEIFRQAIK